MEAADALKRIYNELQDTGSLGGVERLFRRAKQLKVPGVDRQMVVDFFAWETGIHFTQASSKALHT